MKLVSWIGMVAVLAFVFLSHAALADEASGDKKNVVPLEDIVVTASKTPQPLGSVTQKVDVIDSEAIETMVRANGNLAEIVSHLPGAYVNVLAKNQPNWGSVGGLGTNYNTYMLDGLPIDSFSDPMSIDPWIIERVEVQRGPAAVLYPNFLSQDFSGNQSPLAGTTNFILKERADHADTRFMAGYGTFNTFKGRADHRNHIGDFHYYLGGTLESSDYTNYRYKNTDAASGLDMTEDPDYCNKSVDFRGTYFVNNADDHKVSLFLHHHWHDGDMGRPNRELDHNYFTVQGKYTQPVGRAGNARAQLSFLSYDRNFGEDSYPTSLDSRGVSGVDQRIVPGDIGFSFTHWDAGLLTLGTDFQLADYQWFNGQSSADLINDAKAQQIGAYIQEEVQMDRLILRAGGRFNHTRHQYDLMGGQQPEEDEQSWNSAVWSAGLRFNATDSLSVYTNAGSSFLVPAAKYIGGTIRATDEGRAGYSGMLPNPDLDAEEGLGCDVGTDIKITDGLKFGVRGFLNIIDDVIVTETIHEDVNQSRAINGGKNTSYGLEITLDHDVNEYLSWFANYTYTHSRIENDVNSDADDVEPSGYPEHMGNVGARLSLPYDIRANAWLRLVGPVYNSTSKSKRMELDGYEVLSVKLQKDFDFDPLSPVTVFLELNNLTDNRYKTIYYYKDPGLTAFGGIQVVF